MKEKINDIASTTRKNEVDIARIIPKLNGINSSNRAMQNSINSLATQTENLNSQISELSNTTSDISDGLGQIQNDISTINTTLDNISTDVSALEDDMAQAQTAISNLQNGGEETGDLQEITQTIENMQSDINYLKSLADFQGGGDNEEIWATHADYRSHYAFSNCLNDVTNKIHFAFKPGPFKLTVSFDVVTNYDADRTIKFNLDNSPIYVENVTLNNTSHHVSFSYQGVSSIKDHYFVIECVNDVQEFDANCVTMFRNISVDLDAKNPIFISKQRELDVHSFGNFIALSTILMEDSLTASSQEANENLSFDPAKFRRVFSIKTVPVNVGTVFVAYKMYSGTPVTFNINVNNYAILGHIFQVGEKWVRKFGVDINFSRNNGGANAITMPYNNSITVPSGIFVNSTGAARLNGFGIEDSDNARLYYSGSSSSPINQRLSFCPADVATVERLGFLEQSYATLGVVVDTCGNAWVCVVKGVVNGSTAGFEQLIELGEGVEPTAYYLADGTIVIYLNYRNKCIKKVSLALDEELKKYYITNTEFIREGATKVFLAPNGTYFLRKKTRWEYYPSRTATTPTATLQIRPEIPDLSL